MKQLTCEMCGSTDLVKTDGVFVCQSCGCKYSVEEAKKMMVEIDGQVEVKGTVEIDNRNKVYDYILLARSSYDSSNFVDAEKYCNMILEIDIHHTEAWLIKGKASGWQSTLANIRIKESFVCFENAIKYSDNEEKAKVIKVVSNQVYELSIALVRLAGNHYKEFPSNETHHNVMEMCGLMRSGIDSFCLERSEEFDNDVAEIILDCSEGRSTIDYYQIDHPGKTIFFEYSELICLDIFSLHFGMKVSINDETTKRLCLKQRSLISKLRSLKCYEYNVNSYGYDEYCHTKSYLKTFDEIDSKVREKLDEIEDKQKYDYIITSKEPDELKVEKLRIRLKDIDATITNLMNSKPHAIGFLLFSGLFCLIVGLLAFIGGVSLHEPAFIVFALITLGLGALMFYASLPSKKAKNNNQLLIDNLCEEKKKIEKFLEEKRIT